MEVASSSPSSSSSSSCSSPRAAPWKHIVVRGVPLSASEEDLKNHFGRYGEVRAALENEQEMPQDSDSKQACIFFADSASANQASASREKNNHIILGKLVEVSRFSIWLQKRRIEVYNLPPGTTSSAFRAYFEEFGTVTEAVVGPDGSGYVVFKWDESLRKVLKKKSHLFYGTELKVRRESAASEAFLVANAADQHESTSSATPCAHGVADIPTRLVYTDLTRIATTPYDALYTPSYNRPTTAVPHAYSAPTPPLGTTTYTSSDNRPRRVTTYAYGAPSISPYDVLATSFYNWSTTATPHVSNAPTALSLSTLYTPSYNRPTRAIPHAYSAPDPFGTPYTSSDNRPTATPHVSRAPTAPSLSTLYTPCYNRPTSAIPHAYSALTPTFRTPSMSSYNRPISVPAYAYGAPSNCPYGVSSISFYNRPTAATPHVDVETHTAGPSRNSSNNANVSNSKNIFVGGLPRDTTYGEFLAFFGQFGPITNAYIPRYKNTDETRGFGFVTFETEESAHEVLKNQLHEMRPDKKVEVKKAIPMNVPNDKKIFVGSLPTYITEDEIRAYFEKFGLIAGAYVVKDKDSKRSRGFGFVTFETTESVDEVLKNQFHKIWPHVMVEVKKAIPWIEENI